MATLSLKVLLSTDATALARQTRLQHMQRILSAAVDVTRSLMFHSIVRVRSPADAAPVIQ